MDIIVLGAGAVGSFYGAKLSKLNNVLLVGNKKHIEKIRKGGLKITGLENSTYNLKAATDIRHIGSGALILLATKAYDSKKAVSGIRSLLKKDNVILCLQNGLYSENIARKAAGKKCRVLRAITNFGVTFLEPGVVGYNTCSYTAIEKSPISGEVAENFTKCGLNCRVSSDIKAEMWEKVVFNCVINPLTAILGVKNMEIADERLNPLKKLVADECARIAEKDGVAFKMDFVRKINEAVRDSGNTSSMLQDIIKGKCTEIDYLNGAVVKLGKKFGIKCPVNEGLVSIIKGITEAGTKLKASNLAISA